MFTYEELAIDENLMRHAEALYENSTEVGYCYPAWPDLAVEERLPFLIKASEDLDMDHIEKVQAKERQELLGHQIYSYLSSSLEINPIEHIPWKEIPEERRMIYRSLVEDLALEQKIDEL